ncbi:MAG: peptidoglycan editing factor PgeF [Dethiobacteria bacterium]|jgi:YfiH family protein|nr:peptidoglycan editing factor PgeF [Bacillota bacterium]
MVAGGLVYREAMGIGYLEAPLLAETGLVSHGFSTRHGGVSSEPFHTLNLGFHCSDSEENVYENRRRFFSLWGKDASDIVCGNQVHGAKIVEVQEIDRGRGASPGTALPGVDGLYTRTSGLTIAAFSADCLLVFILDPIQRAVAIIHAGWRGTLLGITAKAVNLLSQAYGGSASDLLVALSPAISRCCFEVDQRLVAKFQAAGYRGLPLVPTANGGRYYLDLHELNRRQLVEQGVCADRIASDSWCTYCGEHFFSYRRDNGKTGRMAGFISLNSTG